MPPLPRVILATCAVLGLSWSPALVLGHELEPRHSASIQIVPSEEGWTVNAALLMELPPDPRSRRLIAQYDLNRSGSIDAAEGKLLADALGPETVGGFVLMADEGAPVPDLVEGSAVSDGEGRIRVGIVLSYSLESTVERIGVRVLERPGGGRVEARPILLTMELRDGDSVEPLLRPAIRRPGDPVAWLTLDRGRLGRAGAPELVERPAAGGTRDRQAPPRSSGSAESGEEGAAGDEPSRQASND